MIDRASLLAAVLLLAACNEQQGLPADAETLPKAVPESAFKTIDLAKELPIATAACITSELQGPSTLQSLRSQGYTAIKEMGGVVYAKQQQTTRLLERVTTVRVSDPNTRLACSIEVHRSSGYTGLALVSASLRAQGYTPVSKRAGVEFFAKDGVQLMLSATSSTYSPFADIEIRRVAGDM